MPLLTLSIGYDNKPACALTESYHMSVMQNVLLQMHILLGMTSIPTDMK